MLPSQPDSGTPPGPSTAMGPLTLIPLRKVLQAAFLALPCTQDQAVQQATPSGASVLPLDLPFAQMSGLQMGISMPPLVEPSQPPQGDSAAQPAAWVALTAHGADTKSSITGSGTDLQG